jgi:superfamily II DNA or RNA helicase
MTFAVGSLVRARGREWVVLPETDDELVMVRPLVGTDDEVTGILTSLESVEPATFDLPDPTHPGDDRSARLLRGALRLGFRSSAGPFRSFGHLAVEPRPYQIVPLLMALKLDPVRLLIADDVGIGKTVEAALVARELMDQGDATRLTVLCPPHLAEQWKEELADKFHIDAELVLSSTVSRLERGLRLNESLFDVYPFVVVSTDFIKSDRYRHEFLNRCPELVIVDEAHTCADQGGGRARHQRHQLVSGLAADPQRHLILVTATPHSGNEDAFRSLLAFLDPAFADLPDDLSGAGNERHRRALARHFVQRRRADIRTYLDTETTFPERFSKEESYRLSPEYRALFDKVLAYARETVRDESGGTHRRRVRWWSALALLRSLGSSPAAAAATLRNRSATADTETVEEADDIGRRTVLDQGDDEEAEGVDVLPGGDDGDDGTDTRAGARLRRLAKEADALCGDLDHKLGGAVPILRDLVKEGFRPIVFCRFIPTAEYVADELSARLPKGVEVVAVTGSLPPDEREARVLELASHDRRVLVATDCLSEGINLQDHFDAVVHYDLSWNPTRHEQREGRVDRFGQPKPEVRVVTYYGLDNRIDGLVLDVLLRKHETIRSSLGISVPVPADSEAVVEAVLEGLLLREEQGGIAEMLPGFEEFLRPKREELGAEWDRVADREKRSRTMFAQYTIRADDVREEVDAMRAAVGGIADVAQFVRDAVIANDGIIGGSDPIDIDLSEAPTSLKDRLRTTKLLARFDLPVPDGTEYLGRTHPLVEALAGYVLDGALDPASSSPARRAGVMRTDGVTVRTTLLLIRFRYHLVITRRGEDFPLLAEDCAVLAFEGAPDQPEWLASAGLEPLLSSAPNANVAPEQATDFLSEVLAAASTWLPHVDSVARDRATLLEQQHRAVREAAREKGVRVRVEPQLPADVLGVYVQLPTPTVR